MYHPISAEVLQQGKILLTDEALPKYLSLFFIIYSMSEIILSKARAGRRSCPVGRTALNPLLGGQWQVREIIGIAGCSLSC